MDKQNYLTFDDAVTYLNTTRSTLYKWLQAGKVPGHKLGRQWRFLEEELKNFRSGKIQNSKEEDSLQCLKDLLHDKQFRRNSMKTEMESNPCEIAETLIWDAIDSGAKGVHIQPKGSQYEISYRTQKDKEVLSTLNKKAFGQLNTYFQEVSSPIRGENKRRFFLGRSEGEGKIDLHVRYQQLETVTGPRITLNITRSDHPADTLSKIASGKDLETFQTWAEKSHGIIAVTGLPGSGKTTTIHCFLQDLIKKGLVAFTLEDPVSFIIEGVNHIEVNMKKKEEVEEAFDAIYDSDLDVLALGLSNPEGEGLCLTNAYKAATSGHLVLIQMQEGDVHKAMNILEKNLGPEVKDHLVGIVSQKLIAHPKGKGRKAEYQFLKGNL